MFNKNFKLFYFIVVFVLKNIFDKINYFFCFNWLFCRVIIKYKWVNNLKIIR